MTVSRAPLPLPIATLVRRARNATDPTRKHLAAFYAWEASIRLAVASEPPEDKSPLVVPSTGHWVRAMPERKGNLTDPALVALHVLLSEVGLEQRSTPKSTSAQKLLGMLPPYRNKVIGHGSTRPDVFNQEAARIFLAAIEPAWQNGMFLPENAALFFVEKVAIDADGSRKASLVRLEGLASEREGELDNIGEDVLPGRMYVRRDGLFLPLYPWLLFESSDDRERALFFNSYKTTTEYLDYASGDVLKAKVFAATHPTLDADVSALFGGAPAKRPVPSVRPPVQASSAEPETPEEQAPEAKTSSETADSQKALKKNLLVPLVAIGLAAVALLGGRVWLDTQKLNPVSVPMPVLSMSGAPGDVSGGLEIPHVSDDAAVQSEFRRGIEALLSADIFAAETSFLSVKEKAPRAVWPYLGLAIVAGLQNHYAESSLKIDEAMAAARDRSGADVDLMAIVDAAEKDLDKGLLLWKDYQTKYPRDFLSHVVVAYYYLYKGSHQDSLARLGQARMMSREQTLLNLLESRSEVATGDLPAALVAVQKAFQLQGASPWLLAQRGVIRLRMGEMEAARADLEQAIARRGPFSAHLTYALSLLLTGKPEDEAQFGRERATLLETKNIDDRLDFMCAHPLVLIHAGRLKEADLLLDAAADVALSKGKQGTMLRCMLLPAYADVVLGRFESAEAKVNKVARLWEGFGLSKNDEGRGKIVLKVLKTTIAAEKGDIALAEQELSALKSHGTAGADEAGYVVGIAKKQPVSIPDPPDAFQKFVRLRLIRLQARSFEVQGKWEDAERFYKKLFEERTHCSAVVFDVNLLCGSYVADAMLQLATLQARRGAKDEAKSTLAAFSTFWAHPDADLAVVKGVTELRKKLGIR